MIHQSARAVNARRIPIFVAGRPKPIGHVTGHTFTKSVAASKHFLTKPHAIALDLQSLADAQRAGATLVQITDSETHNTYSAAVTLIYDHGFRFNRGFGNQIALDLLYWSLNGQPSEHERNETIKAAKQSKAGQLDLFGAI
ncbi:MAG: hypothetical protein U0350_40730 [Caldilineaceae bacterium]